MSSEPVTIPFFLDNWAYLKTELSWLDRVLMVSVSRQRKETQGVERIAQTAADRVSSHWWRGMISLDGGKAVYDEHRPVPPSGPQQPGRYQQQLEARIQASQQQGVVLALPLLCDRLNLTVFEKNLVLMALAPEINRRYGSLYRFLQGNSQAHSDLPTVDLVLRLLCRNDAEWRTARQQISTDSPLIRQGLVQLRPDDAETLLSQRLQLASKLVDFLLTDAPTDTALEAMLTQPATTFPPPWHESTAVTTWTDLVLPEDLIIELQRLCQSIDVNSHGLILVLAGPPETEKRLAAGAIAHQLNHPLTELDLATLPPDRYADTLQALRQTNPPILLVRAAEIWLRRSATLPPSTLQDWFTHRQQRNFVTLLSVTHDAAIAVRWRPFLTATCHLKVEGKGRRRAREGRG